MSSFLWTSSTSDENALSYAVRCHYLTFHNLIINFLLLEVWVAVWLYIDQY